MLRKGSHTFALFWLTAGWLILALAGTAFLLTDLYSRALDTNLSNQLKFDIDSLLSATLDSSEPNFGDVRLNDPRFNRASTGWYWIIRSESGEVLSTSRSAVGTIPPAQTNPFDGDNYRTAILTDDTGHRVRAIERSAPSTGRPLK